MATTALAEKNPPVTPCKRANKRKKAKFTVAAGGRRNCTPESKPQAVSVTATPTKGPKPGDIVGPYKILEPLGTGGSGEVFKVEHTVTRRLEAMKILPDRAWLSINEKSRYLREIYVHASLNHQNIAGVYNGFWENGDLVLVMELVRGESLRTKIERERIPLNTTLGYVRDLLAALKHAHSMDVVHRDIKPANIMVTPDNNVKLIDFGLAKSQADPHITQAGSFSGSLYYTSPEQVRGATEADPRSDIYSLGVVLYEMVTGRRPFETDNTFDLMFEHVNRDPVPPSDLEPSIGHELSNVIMTALAKEPSQRFQSAREFREALDLATQASAIEKNAVVVNPEKQIDCPVVMQAPKPRRTVRIRVPVAAVNSLRLSVAALALVLALAAGLALKFAPSGARTAVRVPTPIAIIQTPTAEASSTVQPSTAAPKADVQNGGGRFLRTVQSLFSHDAEHKAIS